MMHRRLDSGKGVGIVQWTHIQALRLSTMHVIHVFGVRLSIEKSHRMHRDICTSQNQCFLLLLYKV